MAERKQVWTGLALGSVGLLALFGLLVVLSGAAGFALDGGRVVTATSDALAGENTSGENADATGDAAMSGGDGDGRSIGPEDDTRATDGNDTDDNGTGDNDNDTGDNGTGGNTGSTLRVVTDGQAAGSAPSDAATTSSNGSTTTTARVTASEASTSSPAPESSTAQATASSATSKPPSTAGPTTAAETSTAPSTSMTVATSTTATTATTAAPTTRPPTTASGSGSQARTYEQEVIRLTNEERSAGGCEPLTNNDKLHAAALAHSVDMAENDYFSHTGLDGSSMVDRVERQGYTWLSLAENIAAGYRSPAAVVEGWMNSSGHRANIMNCNLTEIGVGFHNNYWTQNFGTPR